MANQQLVDYIKAQVTAGVSRLDLQKAVTSAGWSVQDSADAFAVAEGKAPAPAMPQAPKPLAPVQPQPMRPATVQMTIDSGGSRGRGWLWALVVVVALVAAAAAAYYFVPQVQTVVQFYLGQTPPVPEPAYDNTALPPAETATTTVESTTTATTTP